MPPLLRSILSSTIRQVRHGCTNNIDSYHHTIGSKMAPISSQEGAVTLVNMRFCPYAQRTVLCLNAKNVDYEVINSQLMTKVISILTKHCFNLLFSKPEWLWDLNPLGKVPILFHNGNTIYESLITCEYVEVRWRLKDSSKVINRVSFRRFFQEWSFTLKTLVGEQRTGCWWSCSTRSSCHKWGDALIHESNNFL